MQDLYYNAQIRSAIRSTRWSTRLRRAFRRLGCWSYEGREFPMFLSRYVPVGRLHQAASIGAVRVVDDFLTSQEYHVDQTDKRKRSALHYACTYGHPQVASLLIEKNCDINALDDEKSTPLIKAAQWGNVLCLYVLLKHGADTHAVDVRGNNALHYTVFRGNIWMAKLLLACNADIEARTKRGFTPFLLSIYAQKEDMAEFLKVKGADVHAVVRRESASPHVPPPKPPGQMLLETCGNALTLESSPSTSPLVPPHKTPGQKWFKTGKKICDSVVEQASGSASPHTPPPKPPGQMLLETGGNSEDDDMTLQPSPSTSPCVPLSKPLGQKWFKTSANSCDSMIDVNSGSESPCVPPPKPHAQKLLETRGRSDEYATTRESSPSEGNSPEGLKTILEETVRSCPENRDRQMDESSARFSKTTDPDVAGPLTKDKSNSNHEVGETPITHLSSPRQRIPGLNENVKSQPPPALDSGTTSHLTADKDLTEPIPIFPLEMVHMLFILLCILLCFLSPLILAMWAKDVIF